MMYNISCAAMQDHMLVEEFCRMQTVDGRQALYVNRATGAMQRKQPSSCSVTVLPSLPAV